MKETGEDLTARFDRIFNEQRSALGRLVAAYVEDAEDRADLLQEILLAIWKALPGFRGECSERTFIFRIAHNRAVTSRSRRRDRPTAPLDDLADPGPDPAEAAAAAHEQARLVRAVRELAPGVRQAIMLYLEGFTHPEIASVLGISENNVAVRLNRGRSALRLRLQEREGAR